MKFERKFKKHFFEVCHFLCIKFNKSEIGDEIMMKSRLTFVYSLHNTVLKYNPSPNLEKHLNANCGFQQHALLNQH